MAALRQLVEGECGGSNALLQWTAHFSSGKPLTRGSIGSDRITELSNGRTTSIEEEEMVREFLGEPPPPSPVPQSFNMRSLLHEIDSTHNHTKPSTDFTLEEAWASEFGHTHQQPTSLINTSKEVRGEEEEWIREFNTEGNNGQTNEETQWVEQFTTKNMTEEEQWVQEFQHQVGSGPVGMAGVAKEMASTITDPALQGTEFMKFVNKLASEELIVQDNDIKETSGSWASEYSSAAKGEGGFWGQLEKEWSDLVDKDSDHPWLYEYNQIRDYKFTEDNPLKKVENPMEKGLEKLSQGDLPSAVLLFEAAVQQNPEDSLRWQYLGTTQADNEQEPAAIAALEKCLELDSSNLPSLMALAVSYTNESMQSKACHILKRWLETNPKYSSLVPPTTTVPQKPFMHSFMTQEEHSEVVQLYLKAAQLYPEQIDSDVQVGLGVLFNLSNEYEKAVDCFRTALQKRPEDSMLWNKLGATLANGNKSEEAIHAYRQALERAPGFTRCRYNLGISCINLGAHREAIEHFISALDLQRRAEFAVGGATAMSDSIWSTLRLAVLYLKQERTTTLKLVDDRNLDGLMAEFMYNS